MPTPDCFEDIGELRAKVQALTALREEDVKRQYENARRISELENDRLRLRTIGGVIGFILTGLGVFFAEPIKTFISKVLGFPG